MEELVRDLPFFGVIENAIKMEVLTRDQCFFSERCMPQKWRQSRLKTAIQDAC